MRAEKLPLKILKVTDPLSHQPETGVESGGMSPMDPPEAYTAPGIEEISVLEMHPFLQQLCEEHALIDGELKVFEQVIDDIPKSGFTRQVQGILVGYLERFEGTFVSHSRAEEDRLFPVLHQRLIEQGEHGPGQSPMTPVDVMKNDHVQIYQLCAVVTNFFRVAEHLPDPTSTMIVREAALRHAKCFIEALRLHMFREDRIIFVSAHKLLSPSELDAMLIEGE